jgi:hypothetical protein
MEHQSGYRKPLLHSPRERLHEIMAPGSQPYLLQESLNPCGVVGQVIHPRIEAQVLLGGEIVVQQSAMRKKADPPTNLLALARGVQARDAQRT